MMKGMINILLVVTVIFTDIYYSTTQTLLVNKEANEGLKSVDDLSEKKSGKYQEFVEKYFGEK